jgi:hypothetical protein
MGSLFNSRWGICTSISNWRWGGCTSLLNRRTGSKKSDSRNFTSECPKSLDLLPIQPVQGLILAIHNMGLNLAVSPQEILIPVKDVLIRAVTEVLECNLIDSPAGGITAMAICPNDQFILTSNIDGLLQQWDWYGNLIREFYSEPKTLVHSVAISPNIAILSDI